MASPILMAFCPRCGKSVGDDDAFCPSCGFDLSGKSVPTVQSASALTMASPAPRASPVEMLVKAEDSLIKRLPVFSALDFWLLIAGLLLLYDGISEIVLSYGPGLGFAIGAITAAAIYIFLGRTYHLHRGRGWILEASVGIPVLVVVGDFIVTGVFTSLSALLVVVNLVIIFTAITELQGRMERRR